MKKNSRIYVAGHAGMLGTALVKKLGENGYNNLIVRTRQEVDLRNQAAVADFFHHEKPEYVFLAAGKVGGVLANNTFRAEFLYDNLMIEANVIHQSYIHGAKKLLFVASSSAYPKDAPQPLHERDLFNGALEATHEPYSIAKIAGMKLCETYSSQYGCNFISVVPTNLYGPHDRLDVPNLHVIPALIRKFTDAKTNKSDATVWGSGKPLREFLHVNDMADACLFLMEQYDGMEPVNVGTGEEISIYNLVELIKRVSEFKGQITWDSSKPDGAPRKLLDVSKLKNLGWAHRISLEEGVKDLYEKQFGN